MTDDLVPSSFTVPTVLDGEGFRLEPLGPEHNERDHAAWSSSVDHIATAHGFEGTGWPQPMSLESNLSDLERHAQDFRERSGFTYSILDGDEVIGCVYIYPSLEPGHDAHIKWWLTEARFGMAQSVGDALAAWVDGEWPFSSPAW